MGYGASNLGVVGRVATSGWPPFASSWLIGRIVSFIALIPIGIARWTMQ
uniref:Uncharacterized protein n=1 Tax=Arundo donax TaxID=35708 RepID=A0A0A8ZME4_ARUDO